MTSFQPAEVTIHTVPGGWALVDSAAIMGLGRRTANVLLAISVFMLLTWGTRLVVFFGEVQAGALPAPVVHFGLVVINLLIAAYLGYLGVKGRSGAGSAGRARSVE